MHMLEHHDSVLIGGEWQRSHGDARIEVVSPFTEQVIASVPSGDREDIDRAVAAARRALDSGPWPATSLDDRLALLRRFGELLTASQETLAQLITAEMGCPITQSRTVQVVSPLRVVAAYLDVAESYPFRSVRRSEAATALVTREPVGVVAAVVPWNMPASLVVQKLAPALITGCTVVLKPSPETTLDAYLVVRLLEEAGLPPGVVNVVPADRAVSEYLVSHPGIAKVTFTGSSTAGRRIAELAGRDLRRVTLELGGKSAGIILDDADLDQTVEALRLGSFRNNGQVCSLKTRLLVPRALEADVVERLRTLVGSFAVGDPADPATHIGPLVSSRQRDRVEGYIRSGLEQGATLVAGGGRPADQPTGWFVEPTVFTRVDPDATIAQEEIFGPVLCVMTYDTEDEALAIANNSEYGLNGAVYSTDVDRALGVASRIRTGTVEINGNPGGVYAPMGGVKSSGLGREYGPEGLDPFVEPKTIGLPRDADVE
jgi:betaine-aldehyde dehydrogenase